MTLAAAPSPPPSAAALFGERLALARRYADLLCTDGTLRGVIGPRESDRIWPRHLLNSAALAELVPPEAHVVDVGSGAGLPGIPLALARPDLDVVLLEPLARRVSFLESVLVALGIAARVVRGRAQDLAGVGADVVVSRAVAPLARLAPLVAPLLRPGGLILAVKGESAAEELATAQSALQRCGLVGATVRHVEIAGADELTVIRCVRGSEPLPSGRATRTRGR